MNKYEKELFLQLCRFEEKSSRLEILTDKYASEEVLGYLFCNRMQAAAYGTLEKGGLLSRLNREFRNSLADAYRQNLEKNESFFKCADMLYKTLSSQKGKYAMLKGALLCGLYPAGYRTSNDIDLLTHPESVTALGEALSDAGFRQGSVQGGVFKPATRREIIESKMTRGETVPYILEVRLPYMRYFEDDINFSLDYKNSDTQSLSSMLERAEEVTTGSATIITLDKYDFFIHLCSHLYKEATTLPWIKMRRDMTLYKFSDIYLLLNRLTDDDLRKTLERARRLGMGDICGCVILWTSELLGIPEDNAQRTARAYLKGNYDILHTVIAPSEHKRFIYTEKNIQNRFFAKNRESLLKEI